MNNTWSLNQLYELERKTKRRAWIRLAISTILAVAGIAIMLYPVVATFQNNRELAHNINAYQNAVETLPPEVNDAILVQAREYNDKLSRQPFTPPPIGREQDDPAFRDYQTLLSEDPDKPMAQIVIPTADISLPVYHGTSQEVLHKGAGHLYGTHLPVGAYKEGQTVTTAISAHTGMVNASMFDNLHKLKEGESVFIRTRGTTLHYVAHRKDIVMPNDREIIHTEKGRDMLQLITCTPYNINTKRLVVTLYRAPMPTPAPDVEKVSNPHGPAGWQWWMTATSTVAGLFLLVWLLTLWLNRRRRLKVQAAIERKIAQLSPA